MEYLNYKLEEFINYIRFRKVAIIGMGVSNIPLLDYFHDLKARVTVFDNREIADIPKDIMDKITDYSMEFSFGKNYLTKLKGFDLVLRSPSCLPTVPELVEESERGAIVTTEIELLMRMCPGKIIGVTGSDGKTTTTTLISEIIKAGGYICHVGGNIGNPLFTKLNEIMPEDIVVLELSSFQLMGMEISPDIAVITNISPNHLNIHKDYEEYIEAKKNIYKFQSQDGILVTNYDNDITREASKNANGKVIFFSRQTKIDEGYIVDSYAIKQCNDKIRRHLINIEDINIKGVHNYENICAALAATETLVDKDMAIKVCKEFKGVAHRIEFVKEICGVKWYNDSASTTPTRAISALNSFNEKIVMIAGGADKNLDYSSVAKVIVDKVRVLILMGETSEKIFMAVKKELEIQNKEMQILLCDNLSHAIILAERNVKKGEIVLFSPASTSFDMFKNMYERGDKFKEAVNNL